MAENRALVRVDNLKKYYDPFEIAVLAGGEFVTFVNDNVVDPADRERIFEVWNEFAEAMRTR